MAREREAAAEDPLDPPEFLRRPRTAARAPGETRAASSLLRRLLALVALAAVVWLGVMLIGGDAGALAIFRARDRLAQLEGEVRKLEGENARLREEIARLERDDQAIERVAREQLMMARPDEEVLLVPDPRALAATPVPSPTPRRGPR